MKKICLIATLLLFCTIVYGQKNRMEFPLIWQETRYDLDNKKFIDRRDNLREDYYNFDYRKKDRKSFWNVFANRPNIPLYQDADENSAEVGKAAFSTTFYVIDEENEYLKVEAFDKDLSGWCHKKDLILWSSPLIDHITGIEIKAFLVNRIERKKNFKTIKEQPEHYLVYDSPGPNAEILQENLLYDVLFVFGYVNESGEEGKGRFLLSKNHELSTYADLLGWVDEDRLKLWRTNLCLEPNFDESALEARREAEIRATIFEQSSPNELEDFISTGGGFGLIDESSDPAFGNYRVEPRMKGSLLRYPVFRGTKIKSTNAAYPENCRIITGASAKINASNTGTLKGSDDDVHRDLSEKAQKMQELKNNVNIVLLLDGSSGMKPYGELAAEALKTVSQNFNYRSVNAQFGAVVYRNEFQNESENNDPESDYCQIVPLKEDTEYISKYLEGWSFRESGDPSEYEAFYYAFKKATELLEPFETNIIVHLGNGPDRRDKYFGDCKGETCITPYEIGNSLNDDTELHYLGFVTHTPQDIVSESKRHALQEQINDGLINEISKVQYNRVFAYDFAKNQSQATQPKGKVKLEGTFEEFTISTPYVLKSFYQKTARGTNDIQYLITSHIDTCYQQQNELTNYLQAFFNPKRMLSDRSGHFSKKGGLASFYNHLSQLPQQEQDSILLHFSQNQAQIFQDAITVLYHDKVPKQPLFKYVLFLNENKLVDREKHIESLIRTAESQTSSDFTSELQNYWRSIAEDLLGGGEYDGLTIQQIRDRVLGIDEMDLVLPETLGKIGNMTIDDLSKKHKLREDDINQLRTKFKNKGDEVERLLNSDYYFVPPGGGTRFYWVPVELIFG